MALDRKSVSNAVADVASSQNVTVDELVQHLDKAMPIIESLVIKRSGWQFWLVWGMKALINVLRDFLASRQPLDIKSTGPTT